MRSLLSPFSETHHLPPSSTLVAEMAAPVEALLDIVDEVEREVRYTTTWYAEMSMQVSEMQIHAKRWTSNAPRDRYEKRVGKANAFFGPRDWDEIIAFAQGTEREWVYDPWTFFFMLEHLSERFPAKIEDCEEVTRLLLLASESCIILDKMIWSDNDVFPAAKLRGMLERGIPGSQGKLYVEALQEQTARFIKEMVGELQAEVALQLQKAIEVSQQLEKWDKESSTLLRRSV
ncbi:hypothetical protein HD554DRAFT_2086142 [Boletus coccyginus]|nr:hypothetical protein HD554DRAFT_2086142 [Boletus coccyginus]